MLEIPAHVSQIHIRSAGGVCPICYVAEATSYEDLQERLTRAQEIVAITMETEKQVMLHKLEGTPSLESQKSNV